MTNARHLLTQWNRERDCLQCTHSAMLWRWPAFICLLLTLLYSVTVSAASTGSTAALGPDSAAVSATSDRPDASGVSGKPDFTDTIIAATEKVATEVSGPRSDLCVILLHGLARSASAMNDLAKQLGLAGFRVVNVDYPSRQYKIEVLSEAALPKAIKACREEGGSRLYLVTHSMGGILIRDYLNRHQVPELERIVMLAPPNRGSAVVDNLMGMPGFEWFNGPAVTQLGRDENSVPLRLGPITVDTAIIAGTKSINLILSTLLENPDDGKVSVASTRLQGMCALLTLDVSHPFIMKDEAAIEQVLSYLQTGKFTKAHAEYPDCS